MSSEEELSKTIIRCDLSILTLNQLEDEMTAYFQQRRNEATAMRREAIERLEAITRFHAKVRGQNRLPFDPSLLSDEDLKYQGFSDETIRNIRLAEKTKRGSR